jgi:endonuclease/exonuclease/phosphatase (EEP) superfamily protein YafD
VSDGGSALRRDLRELRRLGPWLLIGVLGLVALLRLTGVSPTPTLVLVEALTPVLLLPAYALVALVRRGRFAVAGAALLLVAAHLWWTVPDIAWRTSPGPPAAGTPTVRLVTANLLLDNHDMARLAAELLAQHADVVAVEELSPPNLAALSAAGFLDAYPYRIVDAREGVEGSALFSRLPFDDGRVTLVAGHPMTEATIAGPLGPLDVIAVHTSAPLSGRGIDDWRAQLADLAQRRAVPGARLVLAGDFNATLQLRPLARVLRGGRRDAFLVAGSGIGATWPLPHTYLPGVLPPFLRLDHVIVDPGVGVARAEARRTPGSDHRFLVVDLVAGT